MGMSTQPVGFFTDTIAIRPHEASELRHMGRAVSIREFAGEQSVRLEEVEGSGELIATRADGAFMRGPEA